MLSDCRLYLISPPRIDAARLLPTMLKRALDGGDVASLPAAPEGCQRRRDPPRLPTSCMPIVQARGAAFILNDRPDLAAELGCDGVHVGQEDASYAEARAAVGPRRALSASPATTSRHLAMEAAEAGADYVAFGAFFPTATKDAKTSAEIELLHWWAETMVVPVRRHRRHHGRECAAADRGGRRFPGRVGGRLGISARGRKPR